MINRADLGDDRVSAYAREEAIPVLLEIPFDRSIAEAYSRGDLLVETMPQWKERFQALYGRIEDMVETGP